ncbi:hypothetical protein PV326_003970 [Microctonus aethiopoides]|nr:hypothetical protein PV326_003970 [Microctonus aethiopoides]
MFGRRLRTLLDNIKPNVGDSLVFRNVKQQLEEENRYPNKRIFSDGEDVYVRTNLEKKWSPAKITQRTNKYSYKVIMDDGVERRRHTDNIRQRNDGTSLVTNQSLELQLQTPPITRNMIETKDIAAPITNDIPIPEIISTADSSNRDIAVPVDASTREIVVPATPRGEQKQKTRPVIPVEPAELRRSAREHRRPKRFLE